MSTEVEIPIRLTADATAGTKIDLLGALETKAKDFFGTEEYRLERDIEVEAEEVVSVGGKVLQTLWVGRAYYVNWRSNDR